MNEGNLVAPRDLILLPAFNESLNLPRVLPKIREVMPNVDVLVVDDGSHDDTGEVALRCGAMLVRHPFNLGYGAAVQTGYRFALSHGYRRVAQMDSDGQHRPEDVAHLLQVLDEDQADIVLGSRFLPGSGEYPMPLLRRIGRLYLRFLVKALTGVQFADPTTGFQAIGPRVLELYSQDVFPSDFPDADVLVMLQRAGMRIVEVPVSMRVRESGLSMHAGFKVIYYLFRMTLTLSAIAVGRGFRPLRLKSTSNQPPSELVPIRDEPVDEIVRFG